MTVIITLMFVSAGCGKKPKPVVPSAPSIIQQAETIEPAGEPSIETSKPAVAGTDNLHLNVTAKLAERDVRGSFTLPGDLVNKSLAFNWNAVRNAVDYKVTVLMYRISTRTDSVARITPVEAFTGNETFFTIPEARPLKRYSFTVTAYDKDGNKISEENVEFRTARATRDVTNEDLFLKGTNKIGYAGKTVKVPAWKLDKDGKKYGSTLNITIHQAIADKVLAVFTEIYNGSERFPIYEALGYRKSSGDHGLGLAIDINANENMYISGSGRTVGKLWKPYENPYSITPYGDVVAAFERHGFAWGGDAWSNIDYMHFFYLHETYPLAFERSTPLSP
jgi:hypothetical protein